MRVIVGNKKIKIRELTPIEKQQFKLIKNKEQALNYLRKIKAFRGIK